MLKTHHYDTLEQGGLNRLLSNWVDSDDICCLLSMHPGIRGCQGVTDVFTHLFSQRHGVALTVSRLCWIQTDDIARHTDDGVASNAIRLATPSRRMQGPDSRTAIMLTGTGTVSGRRHGHQRQCNC